MSEPLPIPHELKALLDTLTSASDGVLTFTAQQTSLLEQDSVNLPIGIADLLSWGIVVDKALNYFRSEEILDVDSEDNVEAFWARLQASANQTPHIDILSLREQLKAELKEELKAEIKAEVKAELKEELKAEIKAEIKEEVKAEMVDGA